MKRYLRSQIEGTPLQIFLYLTGCLVFSLGAKFFIDSRLGTDPLDVLCIGMTRHLPLTIGGASGIVAAVFLGVWSFWNRKAPPLTPFFTTFSVGLLIDLWNKLHIETFYRSSMTPYMILAFAVSLCAYASALIIMSGLGIRIMDLVALTMVGKWRWSFFASKMSLEILLFATGWLLGGPVGIGTLIFLFGVGPLIQPLMTLNERVFSMNNYGVEAVRGSA